jgi:chaperonin GroEL
MQASYVRDMVREQQHAAHDGAATAAVLAQAMVARAMRAWRSGANPILLRRGMETAVKQVSGQLSELAKDIDTREQVASVASTSTGDITMGEIIAEAFENCGFEGFFIVQESRSFRPEVKFTEGYSIENGYISPQFVTDHERIEAVLNDPYILIVDSRLSSLDYLQPLLEKVAQSGKPLAVIAPSVEEHAVAGLVSRKTGGALRFVAGEAPRSFLGDIAVLTGGQVISEEAGPRLGTARLSMLGRARKVVVNKDETTIVDGMGDADAISGRVNQIRLELKDAGSDDDRKTLRFRLAKLSGGVAVITVGAVTEADRRQLKQRTEAAILTVRKAIERTVRGGPSGGSGALIPGGGAALVDVQRRARMRDYLTPGAAALAQDEVTGFAIVADSLAEPLKQIAANAGHDDPDALVESIISSKPGTGFEVLTNSPKDMLAAGIIDTFPVTSQAIANAANLTQRLLLVS